MLQRDASMDKEIQVDRKKLEKLRQKYKRLETVFMGQKYSKNQQWLGLNNNN